jgi:hypothetical protein
MATKKTPAPAPAPVVDDRNIVEIDGLRMAVNAAGNVVVVQRRASGAYFPGDVHGLRPEIVPAAIARGEVSLHALSVVDVDDAEDDSAGA